MSALGIRLLRVEPMCMIRSHTAHEPELAPQTSSFIQASFQPRRTAPQIRCLLAHAGQGREPDCGIQVDLLAPAKGQLFVFTGLVEAGLNKNGLHSKLATIEAGSEKLMVTITDKLMTLVDWRNFQ